MYNAVVSHLFPVILASLYLRGGVGHRGAGSPCAPSRAQAVLQCVRQAGTSDMAFSAAVDALRQAYFWEEAAVLSHDARVEWAQDLLTRGLAVTALSPQYPASWRWFTSPALYARHLAPGRPGAMLAIVGSRDLLASEARFARAAGRAASHLGLTVLSGGAVGADQVAVAAASSSLEVLPYGFGSPEDVFTQCARPQVSLLPPGARFSRMAAFERNALLYRGTRAALVVASRYGEGGTWHGVRECFRRKLCPIITNGVAATPAMRAFEALGAVPLAGRPTPELLAAAIEAAEHRAAQMQGSLFAISA